MYDKAAKLFEIPDLALPFMETFLDTEELCLLETMEPRNYFPDELLTLLKNFTDDPEAFVKNAYSRGVLNKAEEAGKIFFRPANFYTRLAFFAQYEPEFWAEIPASEREKIDEWYVARYMEKAKPRLDAALRGEGLIENASFFTLDEAFALIDSLECEPYMVPCNCKSVALNCEKPRSVCILFKRGLNSEWDRGHGRPLSKEEAKAILHLADKSGLMHTSEEGAAICNCCGDCCYPIRASKRIGTQGVWPKQRYRIIWDEKKCVACGRCAKVCNFGAFRQAGRKITFEEKDCWGCTICGSNCPVGAISIEKI